MTQVATAAAPSGNDASNAPSIDQLYEQLVAGGRLLLFVMRSGEAASHRDGGRCA